MTTTVDPVTTYDELVASFAEIHNLADRRDDLRDAGGSDAECDVLIDQILEINRRQVDSPDGELLRCCFVVDNWTIVDGEDDDSVPWGPPGGEIRLQGELHEAPEVVLVARTLLAELRRLRPELGPRTD
jgi:diadenosine tetraphosphatase ApaH/serine/threonine PP2A family protein phosphatase